MRNDAEKKRKLKKIALITAIVFAATGLLWLVFYGITELLARVPDTTDSDISFFEADYNEDIFEDRLYTSKNRYVYYLEFGSGEVVTPENINNLPVCARFFDAYFNTVINGDYEGYKSYFTDFYFKYQTTPEPFTMQKIYDIEVDLYDRQIRIVDGVSVTVDTFIVNYKIFRNNGTFRSDVGSNTIKPLVFELYRTGDTVLINAIKFNKNIND